MSSGLYSGVSGLALGTGLYRNVSGLWGGSSGLIDAFGGGGGPFPGASLYLDFLTPPLDSRITFSRGTNATLVDSTGKITYAPNNLVQRSEEFTNVYWVKLDVTATADVTTAPDGTTTADKFVATNTASTRRLLYANATLSAGLNIFSFYAKAAEYSLVRTVDSAGGSRWFASFDLSNGTVVGGTTGGAQFVSASISAVGDGWYRCWVVFNAAAGAGAIGMVGYPAGATLDQFGVLYAGNGVSGTFFWGAQLEQVTYQTTPGTYNPTTSALYYGPRFDYDPVTLAPRGLMIEEARTNLLLQSETFDNASWPKTDATVTANVTNAPSGTAVADKLAETATTAAHSVSQIVTIAIGTSYTYTVYAKAAERNWIALQFTGGMTANHGAYFDLANGVVGNLINSPASASITKLADGWYRCSITSAPATGTSTTAWVYTASGNGVVSYLGTAGSGVYLWGAQFEAGAFATSYIPTVASTVSRSADVATMTGTNFSSWYNQPQGVLIANFTLDAGIPSIEGRVATISAGAVGRVVDIYSTTSWVSFNGTTFISSGVAASTSLSIVRAAAAYATGDYALSVNGAAPGTANTVLVNSPTQMTIGSFPGGSNYLNGHIRAIAYYNTRLPNTQLQTLTAPSLAAPLALDFISPTYTVGY